MRLLLTEPGTLSPARYRRFLKRAQVRALFPDHLVEGSPYLALNALVLTRNDSRLLRRLTEALAAAFNSTAISVAKDIPALVEMGFPWAAAELLAAEEPRQPLVGRFDFMRDAGGRWWLLEFNADTPSGVREAIAVDDLVHQELRQEDLGRSNAKLAARLVDAFRTAAPRGALGLVTDAAELEDLAQMAFTQRLLAGAGLDVVLGDIDNLVSRRRRVHLLGRPLDALYRYVPFEGMFGAPAFAAIYDAVLSGRLRLLNGLYGLLLQHKGLLARLWTEGDAVVREHLPPTWPIGQVPAEVRRSELVAKQVFGREGEEVFFGDALTAEAWDALRRRRTYVAQRRIRPAPHRALVPLHDCLEVQEGYLTVGCFVVNGRWAGYYTRFGGPITTAKAKWVATFEETE